MSSQKDRAASTLRMIDTPRADAEAFHMTQEEVSGWVVDIEFARQLERELRHCEIAKQIADNAAVGAQHVAEQLRRELAGYRDALPMVCCEGGNPNCHGPAGCLLRAIKTRVNPDPECTFCGGSGEVVVDSMVSDGMGGYVDGARITGGPWTQTCHCVSTDGATRGPFTTPRTDEVLDEISRLGAIPGHLHQFGYTNSPDEIDSIRERAFAMLLEHAQELERELAEARESQLALLDAMPVPEAGKDGCLHGVPWDEDCEKCEP